MLKFQAEITEVPAGCIHYKRSLWCEIGTGTRTHFVLSGVELSLNSENLINHWNMNWVQFKDPVCHMYLAGTVVACWSLTQEETGLNPFDNKYIFITEFSEFIENIQGKLSCFLFC